MAHGDANWLRGKEETLNILNALRSGRPEMIDRLRHGDRWQVSNGVDEYGDTFNRIAQDMVNLGGLSMETKRALAAMTPAKASDNSDVQRVSVGTLRMLQDFARQQPTIKTVGGDRQVQLQYKPEGMDLATFISTVVQNQALGYQDPTSRQEVKNYLASTRPDLFRAYSMPTTPTTAVGSGPTTPGTPPPAQVGPGGVAPPGVVGPVPPVPGARYTPQGLLDQINRAQEGLSWDALQRNLPSSVKDAMSGQQLNSVMGPAAWMQQYLNAAKSGLGGSRAQQQQSQRQLQNLEQQAQGNRNLAGYVDTVKRIVNPLTGIESENLIGSERAPQNPLASYRRGGFGIRNAGLL